MAKADRRSLNVEGSFQHILTDLYAFVATAIAGAVIWTTGWNRADAIAALIVAALMLSAGIRLVRDSARIFLEAAPAHLDPDTVRAAICASGAINGMRDFHIWEVTSGLPALSAHLYVDPEADAQATCREIAAMLKQRFGISHTTLQTEHAAADAAALADTGCAHDAALDPPRPGADSQQKT